MTILIILLAFIIASIICFMVLLYLDLELRERIFPSHSAELFYMKDDREHRLCYEDEHIGRLSNGNIINPSKVCRLVVSTDGKRPKLEVHYKNGTVEWFD